LNYSLRSRHHNKTLICKTSELNDRDLIIRNLYKSIAINFHGTYSPYFVFLYFCIFFILVTFVAVAFLTAFYRNGDDEMTYCRVSCLEQCKPLSAFNKETTLLTNILTTLL